MQLLKLRKNNIRNQIDSGENEQYGRGPCSQMDGMHIKEKETSNLELDKVTKKWMKAAVDIDNDVAERARKIGSSHSY